MNVIVIMFNKIISNITIIALVLFLLLICNYGQGVQRGNFVLGQTLMLYCPIRVKGMGLTVKSVTWEKDGQEFYKYDPDIFPYAIFYDSDGVQIKEDVFFNGTKIAIGPATRETAGFYTCIAELRNALIPGLRFFVNVDIELIFQDFNVNDINDYD